MLFFSPESLAPGHTRVDSSYDSDLSLNVPFSEDPVLHDQFKIAYIYIAYKAMAPHSSALVWKIPWAEEPGRLQSMGSQRVGHD